jgi:2-methylcitrate dehydratase PrpD
MLAALAAAAAVHLAALLRSPEAWGGVRHATPLIVAAALLGGGGLGVFHEDFTDTAAADPDRLALAAKVRCVPDARCDEIFPYQFPAVLRVHTHEGTDLEERVDANRGGPGNPLSPDELATKFRLNAVRRVPEPHAKQITALTYDLEKADDLTLLTSLLR